MMVAICNSRNRLLIMVSDNEKNVGASQHG